MEIPLKNGGVALIDDADYSIVSGRDWHWRQDIRSHIKYAVRYHYIEKRLIRTFMHRLILQLTDPKQICDHKNGDGLDNRRSNLRVCSWSQNLANRKKTLKNKTGFKGVHQPSVQIPVWVAQIRCMYRVYYLGRFRSPEDAARAYDKAALFFFGDFANINFPQTP